MHRVEKKYRLAVLRIVMFEAGNVNDRKGQLKY